MSKGKEVLLRINSISSTKKITQAMKMVSASKLAKFQEKSEKMSYYVNELNKILSSIKFDLEKKQLEKSSSYKYIGKNENPFIASLNKNETEIKSKNILYIVIASDKGLCGSFNSKILKEADIFISKSIDKKNNITVIPIGRKSFIFFNKKTKNTIEIIEDYVDITSKLNFKESEEFSNKLIKAFIEKKYSDIYIIYNKLKGSSHTIIQTLKLLPFEFEDNNIEKSNIETTDYIYEPNPELLIQDLIPKILKLKIYSALLNSLTSENSARMIAMTKASDNADEIIKELKLTYNRTRQAAITKELTEIVGGAEALKSGH